MKHALVLILLASFSIGANAKLLFEGYLKTEIKGKHAGYVLQKDEVDDATKLRTLSYLVWENVNGHVSEDYVQVVSKPAPPPALYTAVKYVNWKWYDDSGTKTEGEVKGGEIVFTSTAAKREVKDSVTTIKLLEKLPYESGHDKASAQTIFATLSTQVFAEGQPAKYIRGGKASFNAFDEEDHKTDALDLEVLDVKAAGDNKIEQLMSEMRSDVLELYTFGDGQPAGSRDDYSDKITYLVNRREEAFGDFGPADSLKRLFGGVPRGLRNPVSESQGKISTKELIESFQSLRVRKEIQHKKR